MILLKVLCHIIWALYGDSFAILKIIENGFLVQQKSSYGRNLDVIVLLRSTI